MTNIDIAESNIFTIIICFFSLPRSSSYPLLFFLPSSLFSSFFLSSLYTQSPPSSLLSVPIIITSSLEPVLLLTTTNTVTAQIWAPNFKSQQAPQFINHSKQPSQLQVHRNQLTNHHLVRARPVNQFLKPPSPLQSPPIAEISCARSSRSYSS